MADRPVEILSSHRADELAVVRHEHAALVVALAERHRLGDGVARGNGPRRRGHHVARAKRLLNRRRQRREELPLRIRKRATVDRRRGLLVPATAESARSSGRVERRRAAAYDAEDAAVHLHEQHERTGIGEVDDLVREVRHALDIARP